MFWKLVSGNEQERQAVPGVSLPQYMDQPGNVYQLPLRGNYQLVSRFMPNTPSPNHPNGHHGVDLGQEQGSPVYSIGPGVVTKTGNDSTGGLYVKTSHENGLVKVYYAHLASVNCEAGQEVNASTVIGTVGNTGNAAKTKPHLHYEIKVNDQKIDPLQLNGRPVGIAKKAQVIGLGENEYNRRTKSMDKRQKAVVARMLEGRGLDLNYINEALPSFTELANIEGLQDRLNRRLSINPNIRIAKLAMKYYVPGKFEQHDMREKIQIIWDDDRIVREIIFK